MNTSRSIELNNSKIITQVKIDNHYKYYSNLKKLSYSIRMTYSLDVAIFKAFMTHKQFFFCNCLGLTAVLLSVSYFSVSKGINSDFNMMPAMKLM